MATCRLCYSRSRLLRSLLGGGRVDFFVALAVFIFYLTPTQHGASFARDLTFDVGVVG